MNPENPVNWAYVFATLGIRFVGVFIILGILQIGLGITSRIVARMVAARQAAKPAPK